MTKDGVTSIGAKKVVTAKIDDGAVTTTQLGTAAVTAPKLSYEVVEVTVAANQKNWNWNSNSWFYNIGILSNI